MAKSRIESSIKNSSVALLAQGINVILNFITRTIFIRFLGASYLGINGLFTNILLVLSFAELGFGTAIIYMLYEPLAKSDHRQVSAVMNFYKKIYNYIGVTIFGAGLMLIPFLDFFINSSEELPQGLPPLWFIYVLYLLNSSTSYFFNYKRSIITASQNGYLDSFNALTYNILRNIIQCISLVVWKSFVLYLLIQIICTMLSNLSMARKADKLFPYLRKNNAEKLDKKSLIIILKNVLAMSMHKLSSVIVSGTDNILISKLIGLAATGYYSNYMMITSAIRTVYIQVLSPITASVGNLMAVESKEKLRLFLNRMFFLNACIAVFCSSCLATLINPFIFLFWGAEYVFPYWTVILIIINFYLNCMRQTMTIMIDAGGLFGKNKWKGIVEAVINLGASILFASSLDMGIDGIILGTIVSFVFTNLWWDPFVVFKYAIQDKAWGYIKDYILYAGISVLSVVLSLIVEHYISLTLVTFVLYCIISLVIPVLLLVLFFRKEDSFRYYWEMVKKKIRLIGEKNGSKKS